MSPERNKEEVKESKQVSPFKEAEFFATNERMVPIPILEGTRDVAIEDGSLEFDGKDPAGLRV